MEWRANHDQQNWKDRVARRGNWPTRCSVHIGDCPLEKASPDRAPTASTCSPAEILQRSPQATVIPVPQNARRVRPLEPLTCELRTSLGMGDEFTIMYT